MLPSVLAYICYATSAVAFELGMARACLAPNGNGIQDVLKGRTHLATCPECIAVHCINDVLNADVFCSIPVLLCTGSCRHDTKPLLMSCASRISFKHDNVVHHPLQCDPTPLCMCLTNASELDLDIGIMRCHAAWEEHLSVWFLE